MFLEFPIVFSVIRSYFLCNAIYNFRTRVAMLSYIDGVFQSYISYNTVDQVTICLNIKPAGGNYV